MLLSVYLAATFEFMTPAVLTDWISVMPEDRKAAMRHVKFIFNLLCNYACEEVQLRGFDVLGNADWWPLGQVCAELSGLRHVSVSVSLETFPTVTLKYAVKELRAVLVNGKGKRVEVFAK